MRGIILPKPTPEIKEEEVYGPQAIAVVIRGRLRQATQEVGGAVRASFSVFKGVIECGEKLEPSLNSGVVVPHFAIAFQNLGVGEYSELGAPKAVAEALESPDDAASLRIERSPMPFRVERSSADVRDGFLGSRSSAPVRERLRTRRCRLRSTRETGVCRRRRRSNQGKR